MSDEYLKSNWENILKAIYSSNEVSQYHNWMCITFWTIKLSDELEIPREQTRVIIEKYSPQNNDSKKSISNFFKDYDSSKTDTSKIKKLIENINKSPTSKDLNDNELTHKNTIKADTSKEGNIQYFLEIDTVKENDGVQMGVLKNGSPFLSQGGLARFVGIDNKHIRELSKEWTNERHNTSKKRLLYIKKILDEKGYTEDSLYIKTIKNSSPYYAYPDIVCMALLKYYAFENKNETAINRLMNLAEITFKKYIYQATGYHPKTNNVDKWHYLHDRINANKFLVPKGYFSIFREIHTLVQDLILYDFPLNDTTIPDGSVGIM